MGLLSEDSPLGQLLARIRAWFTARKQRQELRELKARAEQSSASFRPQLQLKAAHRAAALGLDQEASALYGAAIDGYLEAGRGRAAEVACRQLLEAYPETVRARRTLALLALVRDDAREATKLLEEYVAAAKQFGDDELIRKSLRTMGMISESEAIRSQAAAELNALDDETGAQMVLEGGDVASDEPFGAGEGQWSKALHAALLGADALRKTRPGQAAG